MWQINLWFSWFALTHLVSILLLCSFIPSCTIAQMVWCILSQEKADMVARRCDCRVHTRRNHHFNHRPAKLLLMRMLFIAVISNNGAHFKLDFQITDNTMIVCSNCVVVHFKAITVCMATWRPEKAGCIADFVSEIFCLYTLSALSVKDCTQAGLPNLFVCYTNTEYVCYGYRIHKSGKSFLYVWLSWQTPTLLNSCISHAIDFEAWYM